VPLAGRPEADDEAQRAVRRVVLNRVRHHRRVEERRSFERVLLGQVRADQDAPGLAEHLIGEQVMLGIDKAVLEELRELYVAIAELGHDEVGAILNLLVGHRHDAGEEFDDPFRGRRFKVSKEDST